MQIYENVNSIPSQNVYVDDGGDSESSQYMRDILQVEEQSRCNQLKNKAAQNNIGKRCLKFSNLCLIKIHQKSGVGKQYPILQYIQENVSI